MVLPIIFAFLFGMLISVLLMFGFINYFLNSKTEKNYEHIRQTSAAARAFAAAAVSNARHAATAIARVATAPSHANHPNAVVNNPNFAHNLHSMAQDANVESDQYTADNLPVLRTGRMKIRGSLKVWRDRFFVLYPGLLAYYKSEKVSL
jgi:hypothetical protein